MNNKEIKRKATDILYGRRKDFALLLLIIMILSFIATMVLKTIPIIGFLGSIILGSITTLIISKFTIKISNTRGEVDFENNLYPTQSQVGKFLVINVIFAAISAIVAIPGTFLISLAGLLGFNNLYSYILWLIGAIIIFLGSIFCSIPLQVMQYIIIEKNKLSILTVFMEGFIFVRNNFYKIFSFYVNLIPEYFCIMISLGMGAFYFIPFINTSVYILYKNLKNESINFDKNTLLYKVGKF